MCYVDITRFNQLVYEGLCIVAGWKGPAVGWL